MRFSHQIIIYLIAQSFFPLNVFVAVARIGSFPLDVHVMCWHELLSVALQAAVFFILPLFAKRLQLSEITLWINNATLLV